MKKIKIILLLLIFTTSASILNAQPRESKARGIFLAFGVGPRIPLRDLANTTDLGYGFNMELSYTDNDYLPLFVYAKVGYEKYPGSTNYYQATDHSNLSTSFLPVHLGLKYFFPPLLENILLLMPIMEASVGYTYLEKLHEFKAGTNKSNYIEDNSKLGFSAGGGLSMFMMEILVTYNYFQNNQYVAADLKVRLPLYMNF